MKQNNFFILLLIAGFTTIMTAQVPSYVPTDGLVGYWPFNGNANDVSTNANNGTNNGATIAADRFGNANSAYSFDGVSNKINFPNTFIFNSTQNGTISLWFNVKEILGVYSTLIFSRSTLGEASRYNFYLQPSTSGSPFRLAIDYREQNITQHVLNETPFDYFIHNQWYNITIRRNSATYDLFINGNYYNTVQDKAPNLPNSIGWIVGNNPNGQLYFKGKIDDIGIWNRALTTDEISNLYNANICYEKITVTDTLVINLGTLSYNPVTYNNSITIYPNPAKDRITIDCGTLSAVTGYQIKISNLLGQEVFSTTLNQQQYSIPLNSWTGKGIYLVTVYDANRNLLTTRKIDLQ